MQLTAYPDLGPAPRVEVRVDASDVHPSADRFTVLSSFGRREAEVRGMIDVPWNGVAVSKMDIAAPFETDISYRVLSLSASGAQLGYSTPARLPAVTTGPIVGAQLVPPFIPDEIVLSLGLKPRWEDDASPAFIQCPFDPSLSVAVTLLSETAPTITRATRGEIMTPQTGDRSIWVGSGGLLGRAASVAILTDVAGADMLHRITEAYPVWLIRTAPPSRLPRVWYAAGGDLVERDFDVMLGGDGLILERSLTEVASPAPGLVESLLTYDDLDAAYPSYTVRDAAYSSYTDMDADWSLAGAAGG